MKIRVLPVAAFLFLSGMCALIYQVAWLREFRLVFGATTAASAAVLAVFMGGLGLGNALLGRRADRHPNPLVFYATLECSIALASALSPYLIDVSRWIYIGLGGQTTLGMTGATVMRLLLSAVVLGVPTILMGGTLPAAVRAVETPDDGQRRDTGVLYGMNTLGAVLGAAVSTFLLLEMCGTRRTLWLACAVNLATGLGAYMLGRQSARLPECMIASTPRRAAAGVQGSARVRHASPGVGFIYAAAAIVGFAFLLMELVWYRMLTPILGGTTFTFGLILAVALAGIGLGGTAYAAIFRQTAPTLRSLALTCGLEAACIAFPFALGDRLPVLAWILQNLAVYGFSGEVLGWSVIAGIVVFPAALVAGVQFPVLIALLGRGDEDVGRQVGLAAAWNTGGAILGSLAGGFGLLPLLTAPGTWCAVVVLLCALSLAGLAFWWWLERKAACLPVPLAVVGLALLALTATGPTAVWRHSSIGAGRQGDWAPTWNGLRRWMNSDRHRVIWEAEGVESSVALYVFDGYAFFINGKCDGNAVTDAGTQIMLGLIGGILHPEAKTGLVVGLGTGETAGWLAEVACMERVDLVELEPAVDEVARRCASVNHDVLHHPKVRRIYNDAREVLLTTRERYDLIASEPSNPYRAGVANLYTQQFYTAVRDRLNKGGLFVQWLQAYEVDAETVRTVLATLYSVFPYVEVWNTQAVDMLLVASLEPIAYPVPVLRQRVAQEPFKSALAAVWQVTDLEGLLAYRLAGTKLVEKIARQTEIVRLNTDDCNVVEYGFARSVGTEGGFSVDRLRAAAVAEGDSRPHVTGGEVAWEDVEDQRFSAMALHVARVPSYLQLTPQQKARFEAQIWYFRGDVQQSITAWQSQAREPVHPMELGVMAHAYAEQGDPKAEPLLGRLRPLHPVQADATLAILLQRQGKLQQAADALEAAFRGLRSDPWSSFRVIRRALAAAVDIAKREPSQAARLFAALEQPFAARFLDEDRVSAALPIAWVLGPSAMAQVLKVFEPHVPWSEEFLRSRCQVYDAMGDPLAARAAKDLQEYLRHEPDRVILGVSP